MIPLRGLAINLASIHQTENPRGFLEVGENKQLRIGFVGHGIYSSFFIAMNSKFSLPI